MELSNITVDQNETHHVLQNKPLYSKRFHKVLKFHSPGLAPVIDDSGAYHINTNGEPAYQQRFRTTFGFYNEIAAVADHQNRFFHINLDGKPIYSERYTWVGNYQEHCCAVNQANHYFHIDDLGHRLYATDYDYVGDFKDGIAVVRVRDKGCTHINRQGKMLYQRYFDYLDVFHKGFARAKDSQGWFHINKEGNELYSERYAFVEPYYNELALVHTFDQAQLRIDSSNQMIETIIKPQAKQTSSSEENLIGELSAKMVGFWQIHVLQAAMHYHLFDVLPNTLPAIEKNSGLSMQHSKRLLRALWEMDLVFLQNDIWHTTALGNQLIPSNTNFLASAIPMWYRVNQEWNNLIAQLELKKDKYHPCFKEQVSLSELVKYHQALSGYAASDFSDIHTYINHTKNDAIMAVGSCSRVIIPQLLDQFDHLNATYYDHKALLKDYHIPDKYTEHLTTASFDLHTAWPKQFDHIIFPRYLHYWPDQEVQNILRQASEAITAHGKIYIFEMLMHESIPNGSLLDLNMLVETGGCLRTIEKWRELLAATNLQILDTCDIKPHLSLITATKP